MGKGNAVFLSTPNRKKTFRISVTKPYKMANGNNMNRNFDNVILCFAKIPLKFRN
jgi:hypothetical protein